MSESGSFVHGAARANHLALERPDIAFAAKELHWRMPPPREGDFAALRRLAGYLLGAPREVYHFGLQCAADPDVCAGAYFGPVARLPAAAHRAGARCVACT